MYNERETNYQYSVVGFLLQKLGGIDMTSILIISTLAILVIAFMTLLVLEKKRNKPIQEITKPCKEYTRELRKSCELIKEQLSGSVGNSVV